MKVNVDPTSVTVQLWQHVYRTSDVFRQCMNHVFEKYNITSEQFDVLSTVKYRDDRADMTAIAKWLKRSTNSVSMLVDRMVRAGLVKRIRDKKDRRVVYVLATSKGESILEEASPPCWELVQQILSPLSYEDRLVLVNLLDIVSYKALEYLNPGKHIEEIRASDAKRHVEVMKRVPSRARITTSKAKRQGNQKRKTIRAG